MGYYTNFSIEIRKAITRAEAKAIIFEINRAVNPRLENKKDGIFVLMDDGRIEDNEKAIWEVDGYDEMKWYDWREDMKDIAQKYPDIEFRLEGNGEDKDDWWVALFKGDKFQIKYCVPPIDEWVKEEE